jgi:hypothetical protein
MVRAMSILRTPIRIGLLILVPAAAHAVGSSDVNPGDPCALAAARKALIAQVSDMKNVPPAEIALRKFSVNFSWPKSPGTYTVGISMGPLLEGDKSIEEGSEYWVEVRPRGKRVCEVGKATRIRRMRFILPVSMKSE